MCIIIYRQIKLVLARAPLLKSETKRGLVCWKLGFRSARRETACLAQALQPGNWSG